MPGSIFRSASPDPARVPPGIHPEVWAIYVKREQRDRRLVRGLLAALVLVPAVFIGWRFAHPPPSAPEHYASALRLFERGNARAALAEIRTSLHEAPDVAAARHLAGRLHLHMGAYAEAVEELMRARELGLDERNFEAELGTALLRAGEPRRLLGLLETSTLRSVPPAERHALRGAAQRALGNGDLARQGYEEALALDPRNTRALRGLARLAADAGRRDEALAAVDEAVAADRRDVDSWLLKGELELANGEPALAEAAWRTATDLNPYRPETQAGLVRALLAQEQLEAAALAAKTLAALAPRDPNTLYLRGEIAARRDDASAAIEAWLQTLKRDPAHAETQLALGRLLARRGRREQAFELLGRYVEAHPREAAAVTDFARLALEVEAPARALEALAALGPEALADPQRCFLLGVAALDSPAPLVAPLIERFTGAHAAP